MNSIDAAELQYQDQFTPFAHAVAARIERQEHIKERTVYHLTHPEVKDLDVRAMEDGIYSRFLCSFYTTKDVEAQKLAMVALLKGVERVAVEIATEEADD